jgi:rhodanese-related sulfurtransferase
VLVDVRTPAEFRACHAVGAINVPLYRLNPVTLEAATGPLAGREIALICQSGVRAERACAILADQLAVPHTKVEGGTDAWVAAQLPATRRGAIPLPVNQQMQLVAGSLVLTGVALGFLHAPAWHGLSAFVGAGLVFAGLTGFCPLLNLLSRLPWNR